MRGAAYFESYVRWVRSIALHRFLCKAPINQYEDQCISVQLTYNFRRATVLSAEIVARPVMLDLHRTELESPAVRARSDHAQREQAGAQES